MSKHGVLLMALLCTVNVVLLAGYLWLVSQLGKITSEIVTLSFKP